MVRSISWLFEDRKNESGNSVNSQTQVAPVQLRAKFFKKKYSQTVINSALSLLFILLACALPSAPVNAAINGVKTIVIRSAASSNSEIIQLSEVIAVKTSDGSDVALSSRGASADSVSTYRNQLVRYGAQRTIDGAAAPGSHSSSNFYQSGLNSEQQLSITLRAAQRLSKITLVGRADCCSKRDVYDVELLNESGSVIFTSLGNSANNPHHSTTIILKEQNPSNLGSWGPELEWPLVAVSIANLPDGRVLSYSGSEERTWPKTEQTYSAVWDPESGKFDEMLHVGHNMFCAATAMTPDGKVFVNGGRNGSNSPWTSVFDYQSNEWSQLENMASGGRWYPTTLTLGNGDILTAMGNGTTVGYPDLWSEDEGWRLLNGIDFIGMRLNHNLEGTRHNFPLLSQAPDGRIYHFWDTKENHFISTEGNGHAVSANPKTDRTDHAGGVQVMYDVGKLLITGQNDGSWGGNDSDITNAAFTIDLMGSVPNIKSSGSMTSPRKFHQMIPLPTGEVLVVGGNTTGTKFQDDGSVMHAEMWNPGTRKFRRLAELTVPRDYHSTALLLVDGRVITAGGGYHPSNTESSGTHQDAQIYSPPYLFNADGTKASRPTVKTKVKSVRHRQNFVVKTTGDIDYFSLIKMSSTTHSVNTDIRQFRPRFAAKSKNIYTITMHQNPNVATPGYWMLYAVDTNGVPSIADVIKVELDSKPFGTDKGPIVTVKSQPPVQTNSTANFNASASGTGVMYRWNFGDSTGDTAFSFSKKTTHTYTRPGRYVVSVTARGPSGRATTETFTQMVHRPLTARKPVASGGLVERAGHNRVYVTNPDNDSVAVINSRKLSRFRTIAVGDEPRALAEAPDGRIWVTNKSDATVSIIDPDTNTIAKTLMLDRGSLPHGIVMGNDSAYIALEGLATVVQLNTRNGSERRRVYAGEFPRHLSLSADRKKLYVSTFITPPVPNEHTSSPDVDKGAAEVRVFSTSRQSLSAQQIVRLRHSNSEISEHTGPGIPNYLGPAVISPDGTTAWLPSKQDNLTGGASRGISGLTFDQTVRAITSVIDLARNSETTSRRIDHDNASVGSHGAFGPNGLLYFTSLEGNRQIAISDTSTAIEIARFDVGHAPQSVLVSKDGRRLYVHNFTDRNVSVHDIAEATMHGSINIKELARINTVKRESLKATVLRGKKLFYDARDDRLAALDYMSCASCHNEGGHDGRTWDFTELGEGLRNTITLDGAGGMANGLLHWSANFDELQDFEGQIRKFAGGKGLMSNRDFFAGTRATPLGGKKAGLSKDLDALAAYLASLTASTANPYRDGGELDKSAKRGLKLFTSKGCIGCHSGNNATDSSSRLNLHDIGTLDADSGDRLSRGLLGFDTPTLIGAWSTAPYLHDGSAQSLSEAIQAHTDINLSHKQRRDLAAFVEQLESKDLPR